MKEVGFGTELGCRYHLSTSYVTHWRLFYQACEPKYE